MKKLERDSVIRLISELRPDIKFGAFIYEGASKPALFFCSACRTRFRQPPASLWKGCKPKCNCPDLKRIKVEVDREGSQLARRRAAIQFTIDNMSTMSTKDIANAVGYSVWMVTRWKRDHGQKNNTGTNPVGSFKPRRGVAKRYGGSKGSSPNSLAPLSNR